MVDSTPCGDTSPAAAILAKCLLRKNIASTFAIPIILSFLWYNQIKEKLGKPTKSMSHNYGVASS